MRSEKTIRKRYDKLMASKYAVYSVSEIHALGWVLYKNTGSKREMRDLLKKLKEQPSND